MSIWFREIWRLEYCFWCFIICIWNSVQPSISSQTGHLSDVPVLPNIPSALQYYLHLFHLQELVFSFRILYRFNQYLESYFLRSLQPTTLCHLHQLVNRGPIAAIIRVPARGSKLWETGHNMNVTRIFSGSFRTRIFHVNYDFSRHYTVLCDWVLTRWKNHQFLWLIKLFRDFSS